MREQSRKQNMSTILVLLLFAGFAVCILAVLLTGADSYQRLSQRDQTSYDRRTAVQYIATKVRQNDGDGLLFVGSFDGEQPCAQGDTLYFTEWIEGEAYYTRLYCHDGYVRELFAPAGGGFSPEDGEKVLPARNLAVSVKDGLLQMELELPDGEMEQFVLNLRSGEVAA